MFGAFARTLAVLAVTALPFAAAAQTKHQHSHKHGHEVAAKHGGTIAEVGAYDMEVVVSGGKLMVYVYDEHGDDITKKASKGDAVFVVAGASRKVALAPADGVLAGALDFQPKAGEDLDAVLRVTVSGKTHTGKADLHVK